ncbi:MAG TPA: hypothetical protein VHJ78_06630 [Actinomycetota bacterium]|nr:hypothetical protein [Actinomycetota bacterium]
MQSNLFLAPRIRRRCGAALCVMVLVLAAGCNQGNPTPSGGTKTLTSPDGALQFRVPTTWTQEDGLNEVAALQAGDPNREAYGVVIEDPRRVFASMDLAKFADQQMQELAKRVGLANLTGPERLTVDGKPALQYRLKGFHNAVEVVYLYTFVETPDRFLKIITWSLASNFERNKGVLEQVTASIRELKPLPEASATPAAPQPDAGQVPVQNPGGINRGEGT